MTIDWEKTTFDDHYSINIGWHGPSDPTAPDYDALNDPTLDIPTSRMGEWKNYGIDFARYAERDKFGTPFIFYLNRAFRIISAMSAIGITNANSRIALVGCEFGYTLWGLRNAALHPLLSTNFPNVFGIDNSLYIQNDWVSERIEEFSLSFVDWTENATKAVQDELTANTGAATFDVVINGVSESYQIDDDINGTTELAAFNVHLDACEEGLAGPNAKNIIHLVDTAIADGKSIDDGQYETHKAYGTTIKPLTNIVEDVDLGWRGVRPAHSWLHMFTGQLTIGGT